ncbi:MAG: hypothetical protein K2X03_29355 [Bryobacteraceae bacterium]|nr:hypothetical protein [Bryobacteraceae bacterium]
MPSALAHRIVTAHEEPELDFLVRRLARRLRMAMPEICITPFARPRISLRYPLKAPSRLIVSEGVFQFWEGDEIESRLARVMAQMARKRAFRLVA